MKWWWLLLAAGCLWGQEIQSLTAQIGKEPTAGLFVERGAAYLEAGNLRQAIEDFDRALERQAINVRALELRGRAYTRLGQTENAITDLSGAIALSPASASLFLARSEAYEAAGDARHAIADREEALRLSPEEYNSWARKAQQANQQTADSGKEPVGAIPNTAALAPLNTVVATPAKVATTSNATPEVKPPTATPKPAPVKLPALVPEAKAPSAPASGKSAETASTPAAATPSTESATTHYQRGRDMFYKGQLKEGMVEINIALEMQPRNAVFYNTRGFGYYLMKDYTRAVEDYTHALQLDPDYLNAVHNRALARKNSGDQAGYESDRQLEIELGKKQGIKVQ